MNENLKEAKLKFEIRRKNLVYAATEKFVAAGANTTPGHRCQEIRDKYSYELSQVLVNTDKNLLQQKAKKITPKRIKDAINKVIEDNKKVLNNELSA